MKAFGDRLKHAREAKAVSIHDVAAATRISERYLNALERDDLETLPGRVFAKGYIKSYAEFLDLDAQPLLEAYDVEERKRGRGTEDDERRKLEELARLVNARPATGSPVTARVLAATVSLALVALVAGASWLVWRSPSPAPPDLSEIKPSVGVGPPVPVSEPPHPPDPIDESASPTSNLRISQAGVGTAIVDRNLVGRNDRFHEGEKVWFWTRVLGGKGDRIRHVWMHGDRDRVVMDAELRIGADHWRTYTTLVLEPGTAGDWAVEARTVDGRVLAREEFRCVSLGDGT